MSDRQAKICLLRQDIAYERAEGIHTYRQCKCNRMGTRRGKCWRCLEEEKAKYEKLEREKK